MRVLLVCSPGGHLQQMLALEPAWRGYERGWVTLPSADSSSLLADEPEVTMAHGPTNRSIKNLVRNTFLAWRLLRRRPDAILSTGAGLAVPFFLIGRLLRIRLVYVESVTRTESLSLSGRLIYPLASSFFVQWPAVAKRFKRAEYAGEVL
jgi:UDP-N-acetylglucosamine:LPS N-acetylglucosamine transferase